MDLDVILKAQQDWLDRAQQAVGDPASAQPVPEELRNAGEKAARDRLARLETQRDALIRRFDVAVAEEQAALSRVEAIKPFIGKSVGKPRKARTTKRRSA